MVTEAGAGGASPEAGGGRTADELHERLALDFSDSGSGHAISQRFDGWYRPWKGGGQQVVHGWFFPDASDGPLPEVDPEAST